MARQKFIRRSLPQEPAPHPGADLAFRGNIGVEGLGLRVWGLGFRDLGIQGLGFRNLGIQGLGFRGLGA